MMAQLYLFEGMVDLPWDGRAPRSLTRSAKALFLKRERQKDERFFVDENQLDFFKTAARRPPQYGGAPSLWPLPREGK